MSVLFEDGSSSCFIHQIQSSFVPQRKGLVQKREKKLIDYQRTSLSYELHVAKIIKIANSECRKNQSVNIINRWRDIHGVSYIAKDLSDWPDGLFNKNKIDCTNFWTNFVLIADMKHPKRFDTGLVFEKVLTTFFLVRLVYEKLFDFKL